MTKAKSKMIKALQKWGLRYYRDIRNISTMSKSEITKLFNEAIEKRKLNDTNKTNN